MHATSAFLHNCFILLTYIQILHNFKSYGIFLLFLMVNCFLQQERENYEYVVCDGKIINNQSGDFLHTKKDSEDAKWIFVMSTEKKLYAGKVTISLSYVILSRSIESY